MPKHKPSKSDSESSDSDSGPEDRGPAKKAKSESKGSSKSGGEETSWNLGKNRYAKLTEFKGKWFMDIREFYNDDGGDLKPGRKGIMLTMEQWQKLKSSLSEIDDAIKAHV